MRRCCVRPGFSLICAALLALLALTAGPAGAAGRVALIIGNAAYAHARVLDNPAHDASDMAGALTDLGFQVMLGVDQNREQMQDLVARFGEAARDSDVALFFFAGHAFQVADRNYLLPLDFRLTLPDHAIAQTQPLDAVLEVMAQAKGIKIVLLDACRDNPLRLPGASSGLARVGSAADFLISYATQPGAVAFDGKDRNGTFTEALLNHIRTPAQDISEMMIAVRKDVVARTGGQQIPWESSSLTRQFDFNDGPPTVSPETMFYQVAVRAGDPALMRLYVQRYPDGAHVPEVLAMLSGGAGDTARRGMGADRDAGTQLWQLAQRSRLPALVDKYLQTYPDGPYAGAARQLRAELPAEAELGPARRCELMATHPRDSTESTPGVPFEVLASSATEAIRLCDAAMRLEPQQPRYVALAARACFAAGLRERGLELYRQAAERGDLRAMVSLAMLKESGDGLPRDPEGARALYEKAAAAGSPDAAINLAVTLLDGKPGAQDRARGIALMQKASEAGAAIATFNLGVLAQEHEYGDPLDAVALFERAAREGEPRAYRAAAVLLDEGRGTAQDPAAAAVQLLLGVASDDGALLRELTDKGGDWNPGTLSALQQRLGRAGLYKGGIDGKPGPALSAALAQWRNGGFDSAALAG
ncbi:caspase family protein [Paracoccus sp. (in: a-proteobacteria)]|uniref:caspase family protein n=1 Tax=Paracoccus sp. TaxID=267 RepID=UPI00321F6EC9